MKMEMEMVVVVVVGVVIATCISVVVSSDPPPLQDFCVADPNSPGLGHGSGSPLLSTLHIPVAVNGFSCQNPNSLRADNFFFRGLQSPPSTSNPLGFTLSPVTVAQLPGLNTLSISMARLDFAPSCVNPPHTHPRATEIVTVLDGTLEAGFVTSGADSRLISIVLRKGDVFVFPQGLVHFLHNRGNNSTATAIAAFSSQNPGVVTIADAVFGSEPGIADEVVARALRVDTETVDRIQSRF